MGKKDLAPTVTIPVSFFINLFMKANMVMNSSKRNNTCTFLFDVHHFIIPVLVLHFLFDVHQVLSRNITLQIPKIVENINNGF